MTLRLFALGSNGSGQLGIGSQVDVSTPHKCHFDHSATFPINESENLVSIQGGSSHTLCLTSCGRVFAAGTVSAIHANLSESQTFRLLDTKEVFSLSEYAEVTHIALSWEVSYFVVSRQVVFACGTGNKGELGLGEGKTSTTKPEVVLDLRMCDGGRATVQRIESGLDHVVLITSDGEVYGWGASRRGQLGEDVETEKRIWSPRKISASFHAQKVVAGRNFTFIEGSAGEKLLLGSKKQYSDIETLQISCKTKVFAGWSNLYTLHLGNLKAVGRSDRGQAPPPDLPQLKLFAAGSEHGVACTENGKVIAFGWGEHGNCGQPVDDRGNVAGNFNTIPISRSDGEHIFFLAAGCATTFVAVKSNGATG